jgi:hypothetical protein
VSEGGPGSWEEGKGAGKRARKPGGEIRVPGGGLHKEPGGRKGPDIQNKISQLFTSPLLAVGTAWNMMSVLYMLDAFVSCPVPFSPG